ncbi:MAG: DNA polymerase subunit Cdc27 [Benniella sp.]|nr:MAG: DNA polymerase subunit Cdc27 [Benniella sp.]
MPLDIESQTMELLTTTVEDEKRSITYRWLSRSMGYSVNTAKQLMESYLSTQGKGKVHGTYYVARQDPQTGNQTISLVSQEDLQVAKKDSGVIGYHIYSLEPSLLKDLAILSVANAEASQLQKGKDVNVYRVIHNKDVTISAFKAKQPTSSSTSSAAKAPPPAKTLATSTATPSSTSSPAATASKGSKPGAKSSMANFFGKAATAPSKPPTSSASSASASKTSTLAAKPNQQKRKADSMMSSSNDNGARNKDNSSSDEEVDSEEERDRRLALSSRLDQDQDVVVKKEDSMATKDTAKRSRSAKLLAIDDDDEIEDDGDVNVDRNGPAAGRDDEDESIEALTEEARIALSKEKEAQRLALENMMLMDDGPNIEMQGEDSVMADGEEAGPSKAAQNEGTSSGTPGRRRGHRTVMKRKTYRNERGYMVTEDYKAVESFSEDDTPAPAPAPVRVEKAAQPVKGKTEGTTGGKKKAGSGNQSLLNFWGKK